MSKARKIGIIYGSWDELLLSSVREGLERVFGKGLVNSVVHVLSRENSKINLDNNLNIYLLIERLQNVFQEGSKVIELEIAKSLYLKMCLPFSKSNGLGLLDYLEKAKKLYDSSSKVNRVFQRKS